MRPIIKIVGDSMDHIKNGSNLGKIQPQGNPTWQLIALFGIITLVLIIAGAWFYDQQSQNIRTNKYIDLKSIAELKVGQIVQWRLERMGDAQVNSESPFMRFAINQWLKTPEDFILKANILSMLQLIKLEYSYQNVDLADSSGELLLSSDSDIVNLDDNEKQLTSQTISSGVSQFGDFYRNTTLDRVYLNISAPILDEKNKPIAVLILQVDPEKYLYPLIQSWPTPSRSAETLLVRKDGADALFLNTLRHSSALPLTLRIPLSNADVPSAQAIAGKSGLYEGHDYRGIDVLSELVPIPGTSWFMIAKVDTDEILAEIRTLGLSVVLFMVLTVLMTAVLAYFIFNNRQRLLYQDLYQAEIENRKAQEETRTTLYSIGDGVITTDQAGLITRLNPVAEHLTGWNETEAQGKPLFEVFRIINETTRDVVENPVLRVLREGVVVGLANHTLLIARDNTERPIADSGAPIRDENGDISGVVLVFRDQTEERAALKEQALLTYTINTSLNEIYLFDATSLEFRYVNSGALINLGYSLDQMQAMTPLDIKPEFTRETFQNLIHPLLEHIKPSLVFETIHRRADESFYPVEVHLQLFEHERDRVFLAVIQDITVRKYAEEALRNSEESYRQIFEQAADGIFIADNHGNYTDVNSSGCAMLGYTPGEIRKLGIKDLLVPEDLAQTPIRFNDLGTGKPVVSERRMRRKDGALIDVEISGRRLVDGRLQGMVRDISDRKRAEEALRNSEQLYRAIGESIDYGVWVCDADGRNIYASESFLKLVGITQEQCSDFGWGDILHPDDAESTIAAWKECVRTGGTWNIEHRFRGVDGKWHPILARGVPIRNGQGEIQSWAGINLDISQLKQSQEALQTALARFMRIVDSNIIGIVIAKADGSILEANDYYLGMLGYTQADLKAGKVRWTEITPPEYLPLDQITIQELAEKGTGTPYEKQYIRQDGSRVWVLITDTMLPGAEGEIAGLILDISAQKSLEESLANQRDILRDTNEKLAQELRERLRAEEKIDLLNEGLEIKVQERTVQLESANKELEAFAYSVSHDLRAPLRAMDGFSSALLKDYPDRLDEKGRHYLERIQEASRRMGQLVNDLLSLSRVTRTEFNRQEVNLSALANEIADNLTAQVSQRIVRFDISPDLIVQGDAHLLKIVLENLLNNAFKFTGQREQAFIQVGVIEQADEHVYFVRDNGVGFDMNYIGKLFAPFQRLHSMQEFPGTGIGLVSAQRIIQRHGGRIWPEAILGEGATFYFTLGGE
jgi:PAS domain S-box-containing protein